MASPERARWIGREFQELPEIIVTPAQAEVYDCAKVG